MLFRLLKLSKCSRLEGQVYRDRKKNVRNGQGRLRQTLKFRDSNQPRNPQTGGYYCCVQDNFEELESL
jgi:hypothetical protein